MSAPDPDLPLRLNAPSTEQRLFPTLTREQMDRLATHGHRRTVSAGELLADVGNPAAPFFVVVSGAIDAVRPTGDTETLIVRHRPGQFSGEGTMITGRRTVSR